MATPELYTKGSCVWVPDNEEVWVSAQLQQDYRAGDQKLILRLSDGREIYYSLAPPAGLPPLGNPEILEGENDLTALSFLHEPAVLHNLRVRFLDYRSIYTYCGIVLVALNPYEQLPIYGKEVIDAYSGQDMADMDPHIFSLAEEAYRTMIREERNQSIIISGESGSGKTVSAKFTMRYFAVVGGAAQQTTVEEKVLASNPIMEAIGNAKTTRNDNSSRFGKYIEIGFGCKGDIIGANMRTYLLEKSRVVFQAPEERNYHIFYQLCAIKDCPEMRPLKLDCAEHFRYTNQGLDINIPDTDDAVEMENTRNALTIMGVQPDQQMELFQILAAVLHLGNVDIQASGRGGDRSYICANDRSLVIFSKLMGVDGSQMAHWLCHQRLTVAGEMLVKPMSAQQANGMRDALAKHVYGQLFAWTVQRLNLALRAHRGPPKTLTGVLDIYGFETFDRNSFEQFCINYANEKLQQQFNRHVFQLEQEEYEREELPWNRIEFSDNQPCITLIEGSLGLLDLLDEECRVPKGSDENWARKLYEQHLDRSPNFRKPRMSNSAFTLLHFADGVQYECHGFLEKNRDTVFEEPINIMKASQLELVAELFQQEPAGGGPSASSVHNGPVRSGTKAHRERKLTVGFQFRQSLQLLMDTLNRTTPHYIRCIKPNDLKQPFTFDPRRAVQQLRACGVLETIRISAAGYPSRWPYEEFFSRYRVLLRDSSSRGDLRASCRGAIPALIPDPEQYRFGRTKVFFRAGQVAVLERLRAERLRLAAVLVQSGVRGWLQRLRFSRLRQATLTLQRYSRGALARRLAWRLRYTRAALVIQKTYRMVVVRQPYLAIREAAITIQAFARGLCARRACRQLRAERAAVRVQAWVRGCLARRRFCRVRAAVVLVQCCVRRRAARRELRRLRAEARSVERYQELHRGMEVKLMQLQRRADQEARESASLRQALQAEHNSHSREVEKLCSTLSDLQRRLQEQSLATPATPSQQQEEERRQEKERAAHEILLLAQEVEALKMQRDSLEKERDELTSRLQEQQKAREDSRQEAAAHAQAAHAQAELEEERRRYQALLREFTRLEQRYDNLRDMSMLPTAERWRGHRRTDSMQSLAQEPLSPLFPDAPSAEEARRTSVTSPLDMRGPESPLSVLMEDVGVLKDTAERIDRDDLHHAFDAVRIANKLLERQLLTQRSEWEQEKADLVLQLQQAKGRSVPASRELKDLMEQMEVREQECYRLRRELKDLKHTVTLRKVLSYTGLAGSVSPEPLSPLHQPIPAHPGLLECRRRDESRLIKNLITDVRVDVALSLGPGLPARLIFLCVRQADCSREPARARGLCVATLTAIKTALKKHSADLEMTALWLKNSSMLKDLLTQHSAAQKVQPDEEVLPLQVELKEQVRQFGDVCIQAYQQLLSICESRLQPIIVPAVLESETIPGLGGGAVALAGSRKRAASDPRASGCPARATMAAVLKELGAVHEALGHQELPTALLEQVFRQLCHLLAASALNSLFLRKDMCCWSRGLQIRYNVSLLEEWLRSCGLQTGGAAAALEPLIQTAQLLQMSKKTEADGQAVVQTCSALSSQQIVKILTQYTPQSDVEERVTLNFIRIVQGLLKGRSDGPPPQLLLDVRRVFPVTFPYLPPPVVSAEHLDIPDSLKVSFLRRV